MIIPGDNNWQEEEDNRTSHNYRVWAGDFCGAANKINSSSLTELCRSLNCDFPRAKAVPALLSLL